MHSESGSVFVLFCFVFFVFNKIAWAMHSWSLLKLNLKSTKQNTRIIWLADNITPSLIYFHPLLAELCVDIVKKSYKSVSLRVQQTTSTPCFSSRTARCTFRVPHSQVLHGALTSSGFFSLICFFFRLARQFRRKGTTRSFGYQYKMSPWHKYCSGYKKRITITVVLGIADKRKWKGM